MQNIAFIIMELLYPFSKGDLVVYKHDIITDLLKIKYEYKIGKRTNYQKALGLYSGDADTCLHEDVLYVVDAINIDGASLESEDMVIKKNMSSNIAEVLGCKRQNADMLIKRGNSIVIRTMDYTALQYLETVSYTHLGDDPGRQKAECRRAGARCAFGLRGCVE